MSGRRIQARRPLPGRRLSNNDLRELERSWITRDLAEAACLRRLSDSQARALFGIGDRRGEYGGIGFPYFDPVGGALREWRLRRDNPDAEWGGDGSLREGRKYIGPPQRPPLVYFPPEVSQSALANKNLPVAITEGEKKTLALACLTAECDLEVLPIGISGVWNWRGTIGKEPGPTGARREVRGLLPDFSRLEWEGRTVFIVFDADKYRNRQVAAAEQRLARELRRLGARVRIVNLPRSSDKVGIDDYLAEHGPEEGKALFEKARSLDLPELDAGDGDLDRITGQAWDAIAESNNPTYLFRLGDSVVRVEESGKGVCQTVMLDRYSLRFESARSAHWFHKSKAKDVRLRRHPPIEVITNMLQEPSPPLPRLKRIVQSPVILANGEILSDGFHEGTGLYCSITAGDRGDFAVDPVCEDSVKAARCLLLDDLLHDFPFRSRADRATAVALLLAPFVRHLVDGPMPLHLIDKPASGTGATYLVAAITSVFLGVPASSSPCPKSDDEFRKMFTATLLEVGSTFLFLDNVEELVGRSAKQALTASTWADRVLGASKKPVLSNELIWVATGNNVVLDGEMARRTVYCRLDAGLEDPTRRKFRRTDLLQWVRNNRRELLRAVLILCRHWHQSGRPRASTTKPSFDAWAGVVGGILETAGIPGFLAHDLEFRAGAGQDNHELRNLLTLWWSAFKKKRVSTSDVFKVLAENESDIEIDLGQNGEDSMRKRLGKFLSRNKDRPVGVDDDLTGLQVAVGEAGVSRGKKLWRLRVVAESATDGSS